MERSIFGTWESFGSCQLDTLGVANLISSGAGSSKGKASWTAKPELSDYISFVGFFLYYVNAIPRPTSLESSSILLEDTNTVSSNSSVHIISSDPLATDLQGMTLVLGGYSYGALITTHLPPIDQILERFADVSKDSTEAEIRLRAHKLSIQWNKEIQNHSETRSSHDLKVHQKPGGSSHNLAISFGGDETESGHRRAHRESKHSLDIIRRSIDRSQRRPVVSHTSSDNISVERVEHLALTQIAKPRIFYLLISPLLPPISLLATMFSKLDGSSASKDEILVSNGNRQTPLDERLVGHPTLAIYGDKDFFTSQKRLRRWAESFVNQPNSLFSFREITGAGHFWQEEGVDTQMRSWIRKWLQEFI